MQSPYIQKGVKPYVLYKTKLARKQSNTKYYHQLSSASSSSSLMSSRDHNLTRHHFVVGVDSLGHQLNLRIDELNLLDRHREADTKSSHAILLQLSYLRD